MIKREIVSKDVNKELSSVLMNRNKMKNIKSEDEDDDDEISTAKCKLFTHLVSLTHDTNCSFILKLLNLKYQQDHLFYQPDHQEKSNIK